MTDDTAAFQLALDAAGKVPGSIVDVPRGNYFFAGHINVTCGVTLVGVWQSVPAHNGIRDQRLPRPTDDGTTFLVTEGEGRENGPAFLTLNTNSVLRGQDTHVPRKTCYRFSKECVKSFSDEITRRELSLALGSRGAARPTAWVSNRQCAPLGDLVKLNFRRN